MVASVYAIVVTKLPTCYECDLDCRFGHRMELRRYLPGKGFGTKQCAKGSRRQDEAVLSSAAGVQTILCSGP
eukprot:1607806-Pleurochrysis_carterae.AAC.4